MIIEVGFVWEIIGFVIEGDVKFDFDFLEFLFCGLYFLRLLGILFFGVFCNWMVEFFGLFLVFWDKIGDEIVDVSNFGEIWIKFIVILLLILFFLILFFLCVLYFGDLNLRMMLIVLFCKLGLFVVIFICDNVFIMYKVLLL